MEKEKEEAKYYDEITGREVIGNILNKKKLTKLELDHWAEQGVDEEH